MQHFLLKESIAGLNVGDKFYIEEELTHYILDVLHINIGEIISLSDESNNYKCKVIDTKARMVNLEIIELYNINSELDFHITLFQAIPKSNKFETIIQKCVELGVNEITPLKLKRNVSNIDAKETKKIARFQAIADNAANQSKRQKRCIINNQVSLDDIDLSSYDKVILAYEEEKFNNIRNFIDSIFPNERIAIIIGSEGGFTVDEVERLKQMGAISITLGNRILRTETAAMAVISLLTLGR